MSFALCKWTRWFAKQQQHSPQEEKKTQDKNKKIKNKTITSHIQSRNTKRQKTVFLGKSYGELNHFYERNLLWTHKQHNNCDHFNLLILIEIW